LKKKKLVSGVDYFQSWQNMFGNEPNGLDTKAKRKAYWKKRKK
jgi:hypothetical protein|tara:strand:- start:307 stop:435 length:129 start_codon:yes stop_codon:yes gene_type:complete